METLLHILENQTCSQY
uniref:Uncharacterized protein n=1 Tax=Anguilla anguilla TaxID=7936 RepID=A0A0E9U0X9_ANGAN